jgi:hypothetical protein
MRSSAGHTVMSHVSDKLDIVPPTLAEIDRRIEERVAAEHQLMIESITSSSGELDTVFSLARVDEVIE